MSVAVNLLLNPGQRARGLLWSVHRLRKITGFVTVYGEGLDPRTEIFARLWHVRRVQRVCRLLAKHRTIRRWENISIKRIEMLCWLHDLNRWPFAHNSELRHFDQSANTKTYLRQLVGSEISEFDLAEIVAIQNKHIEGLSPEAECVLAADAIAGLVEDLLLFISGLRVRPEELPASLAHHVGFDHRADPWRRRAFELAQLMRAEPSAGRLREYHGKMGALFRDQIQAFLAWWQQEYRALSPPALLDHVGAAKRTYIRPHIFPINNELVCRSSWLRNAVMPWYFEHYAENDLVWITEEEFVARLLATPDCPFVASLFVPDLDVIDRDHPEMSFVG